MMETISLILSKGMYGLLKTHVRTNNKLSVFNKTKLDNELTAARVMISNDIPPDVVAVNRNVRIIDLETKDEQAFDLVAPSEAKISNNKISVLSPLGIAVIGYREGTIAEWDMPEGLKTYKVQKVSLLSDNNR